MTSPWLQASQTASGPRVAFHSRTAATARACVCASPSPSGPGKTAADGCCWTTFHSGSLASSLSGRPVQSPYLASPNRSSVRSSSGRPSSTAEAVCRQRSSGLLTTAASGLLGKGGFGQAYLARRFGRSTIIPDVVCLKVSARIDGWLREAYFGQLLDGDER